MLLIGRIFAGLSHGIVYVTFLIHAGEIANPRLRGFKVSLVHVSLFLGVFVSSTMNFVKTDDEGLTGHSNFNFYMGIAALVYLIIGGVSMYFFFVESPVFYIKKQQSQKAQDLIMKLRNENELSDDTRGDFEDLQLMVTEDLRDGDNVCSSENVKSLSSMIILKLAFVCTFNMPLNMTWLAITSQELRDGDMDTSAVALTSVRLLTLFVVILFIDCVRRSLAGIAACALSLITLTLTLSTIIDTINDNANLMMSLAFLAQFFSAIGVGIHADVYSTECYSSLKKPMSIAFTTAVELLAQILLVLYSFYSVMSPHWILAIMTGILIGTFLTVIIKFPDTARISLVAAKIKFYAK